MKRFVPIAALFTLSCFATQYSAAQPAPKDFSQWVRERVGKLQSETLAMASGCVDETRASVSPGMNDETFVEASTEAVLNCRDTVGENGKGLSRERESPSADDRSTSLVDQSSSSEFFSLALNLIPVPVPRGEANQPSTSTEGSEGSAAVTVTAYSILAAANGKGLTDPAFYRERTGARSLSFTLGTTASVMEADNTDRAGTLVGVKYVLINQRDLYSKNGQSAIREVVASNTQRGVVVTKIFTHVQNLLFLACDPGPACRTDAVPLEKFVAQPADVEAFATFWEKFGADVSKLNLTPEVEKQIDDLIRPHLGALATLQQEIDDAYDRVRAGRQLAFSSQVISRPDEGHDDYRAQLIYDHGLSNAITMTVNASVDYKDRQTMFDSRGGRVAIEFLGNLTDSAPEAFGRLPITLGFGGESKWMSRVKPEHTFQAKLTIPVSPGVDLPVVYRWANRRELMDRSDSEVRFGLSLDVGRLAQQLRQ
jgi:hypothetical protein